MFSCPAWINYASILTSPIQTEAFIRSKTRANLNSKDLSKMESFQAIEKINSTSNLSAKHFEDGTINLNNVMEEVNYLKQQITNIRQEIAGFLTGLASIAPDAKPIQVFEENVMRAASLQKTLDDYVERYKKLLPLLELIQRDLKLTPVEKQEPSIKPIPMNAATGSGSSTASTTITATTASANVAKKPKKRAPKKTAANANLKQEANDGSETQPILL